MPTVALFLSPSSQSMIFCWPLVIHILWLFHILKYPGVAFVVTGLVRATFSFSKMKTKTKKTLCYWDSNSNSFLFLARDSLFFNFSVLFTRQRYKGLGLIKQRDGCIYFHRWTEEWDYLAHRYPLTISYCVNLVGSTNERQTWHNKLISHCHIPCRKAFFFSLPI